MDENNVINSVYIDVYSSEEEYHSQTVVKLSLESLITYCIYKTCSQKCSMNFVYVSNAKKNIFILQLADESVSFVDSASVPWQVAACLFPVAVSDDTIITGLCSVTRHICKYSTLPTSTKVHEEGLLGFRKSCLQAPNKVSVWTKFCEIDMINTVNEISDVTVLEEIPINLVRFENHLSKPVRVHNVYKIARDLKKGDIDIKSDTKINKAEVKQTDSIRNPKPRKWKSKMKKEREIDCSINVEDLEIDHQFAEGPFLTLADLVLLPSYHILLQYLGHFKSLLPLTCKWYNNVTSVTELKELETILSKIQCKTMIVKDISLPETDSVSLYKHDPKRHNPKKLLFTKDKDIENALSKLMEGMELNVQSNNIETEINWTDIPDGANPNAGHLPDERMLRKSQQLENLALAVKIIAKDDDYIVDFCSGSGHLGILIAHLLPKCTVILLENKEQSLLRARQRVHDMGLKNVYFFQCNLDFFIGKFDIGMALHACGSASDQVLDKCLKANAKFVLCPCCYGSLHDSESLSYPRSKIFSNLSVDQYICISHAADQTHEDHALSARGARCMAVIDSDRAQLAKENGYSVTLTRLQPLSCSPKNNLLIGIPSQ